MATYTKVKFTLVEIQLEDKKKSFSVTKFVFRESKICQSGKKLPEEVEALKDKAQISTEYYAGCDDGQILCGNFKLFRDETGKFRSHPLSFFKSPHSGRITAITLSPFICDVFLSTGGRTICIWKHSFKDAPIYTRDMHVHITSAEWSNTRPALFILGYEDGSIEMWDLLANIYEPFLIHFVSTTAITAISIQTLSDKEHVIAVGDFQGIVYVLSLPFHLWMPVENEQVLMVEFIEKGRICMENSFKTMKHIQETSEIKEKQIYFSEETFTDEFLKKNYEEYLELEKIHLKNLGLIKEQKESEFIIDVEETE